MAYRWDVEALVAAARAVEVTGAELAVVRGETGSVLERVRRSSQSTTHLQSAIVAMGNRSRDFRLRATMLGLARPVSFPTHPAASPRLMQADPPIGWDWRRVEYMAREYVLYRHADPSFLDRFGTDGQVAAAALHELGRLDLLNPDIGLPPETHLVWLDGDERFDHVVGLLVADLGRLEQDKWMAVLGGITAAMGDVSDLRVSMLMSRPAASGWIDERQARIGYPFGFDNTDEFDAAARIIRTAADADGVRVGVRGSAATGISYRRGIVGHNIGDIDFFIVSDEAFERGILSGARSANGALPVGATLHHFPDLVAVEQQLKAQTGYRTTIRVFSVDGFEAVRTRRELFGR